MHTCFLHTWTPLALPWRCCWSFTKSRSSAVISVNFFQLGCGLVKRLVGLGRFELDHPALQCFSVVVVVVVFLYFDFIWIFKCSLLLTDCTRHLTLFKSSYLLIAPFYTSSSFSLLMTVLASFSGLGTITIEDHQHDSIMELGMSNLPSYLSKIFNLSMNLSLRSFACFSAKCDLCPSALYIHGDMS